MTESLASTFLRIAITSSALADATRLWHLLRKREEERETFFNSSNTCCGISNFGASDVVSSAPSPFQSGEIDILLYLCNNRTISSLLALSNAIEIPALGCSLVNVASTGINKSEKYF